MTRKVNRITFLFPLLISILGCETNDVLYKKHLSVGNRLLLINDYNSAMHSYSKAISHNKEKAWQAYREKGYCYYSLGVYAKAINCLDSGIEIEMNDYMLYLYRAQSKDAIGDYLSAIDDYHKALSFDTSNLYILNLLGNIACKRGDYGNGILLYTSILEKDSNYCKAYNNRSLAFRNINANEQSIIDSKKAISLCPDFSSAYFNLGLTYSKMREYDSAISSFLVAINIDSNNLDYYNSIGVACYMDNRNDEACMYWSKSFNMGSIKANEYIQKYCK